MIEKVWIGQAFGKAV